MSEDKETKECEKCGKETTRPFTEHQGETLCIACFNEEVFEDFDSKHELVSGLDPEERKEKAFRIAEEIESVTYLSPQQAKIWALHDVFFSKKEIKEMLGVNAVSQVSTQMKRIEEIKSKAKTTVNKLVDEYGNRFGGEQIWRIRSWDNITMRTLEQPAMIEVYWPHGFSEKINDKVGVKEYDNPREMMKEFLDLYRDEDKLMDWVSRNKTEQIEELMDRHDLDGVPVL